MNQIQPNSVIDRCVSTNDLVKVLAEAGHPHGTWMSTRIQERGRGRLGRKWACIEGNLFLSVLVRFESASLWSWTPLATAVGITRYLKIKFPALNLQIKWPNDLYLNGRKLGGILCEGAGRGSDSYIIIGIGLNCVDSPVGLDQETVALSHACNSIVTADDVRQGIVCSVLQELDFLIKNRSSQKISDSYDKWAFFAPGTLVSWGVLEEHTGKVQGLGLSSELNVILPSGEVKSLYAEDVKIRVRFANPDIPSLRNGL